MLSAEHKNLVTRELALTLVLLLIGLVLVPLAIYLVGQVVFGDYGESGFSRFFRTISQKIRSGDLVTWFLVLSPYLGWQCLRLMRYAWRWSR